MSREEQPNCLSLKLVPPHLFLLLIYEFCAGYDIEERLWFPRELLPIGIVTNDGAPLLADELTSLPIDKDQSGDGIHLESCGQVGLQRKWK